MLSIAQLRRVVETFDPLGEATLDRSRRQTIELLAQGSAALDRTNYAPGHVTASGVVLSEDRSDVLLVFHNRLGRWLQPGGHVEPDDASPDRTAAREVIEETGIQPEGEADAIVVGIDVHEIPAARGEPAHLHHDLVWRFLARKREKSGTVGERWEWWPVTALAGAGADLPLIRAVQRAIQAG